MGTIRPTTERTRVLGAEKRPGREPDHYPPSRVHVKKEWSCISDTHTCIHGFLLGQRYRFLPLPSTIHNLKVLT